MKFLKNLICLLTALAIAAALCSCTEQDKQDIPDDQPPAPAVAAESSQAQSESTSRPSPGAIVLEYFYNSYTSEDDYMVAEKPPQEYLTQSLLTDDLYINRYFVKLYETDYSEEELIEKVYPGDWRGEIPPPEHLPKPYCTTIRCSDNDIPTKPYESNFLPEGAQVHIQDPYSGYSFAAAVYDTDDGKKMTILRATMYHCSTWYKDSAWHDQFDEDNPVPVPMSRAPKAAYIEDAGYFAPQMVITVGPTKTYSSEYLAARYYSDSADITQAQLDEILQDAGYAGEIKKEVSRNMFVDNDSESNFLPEGTKIYTTGEEAIAVLPEPILHEESGRYIVAVRLFKSGSAIDSAEARELARQEK